VGMRNGSSWKARGNKPAILQKAKQKELETKHQREGGRKRAVHTRGGVRAEKIASA